MRVSGKAVDFGKRMFGCCVVLMQAKLARELTSSKAPHAQPPPPRHPGRRKGHREIPVAKYPALCPQRHNATLRSRSSRRWRRRRRRLLLSVRVCNALLHNAASSHVPTLLTYRTHVLHGGRPKMPCFCSTETISKLAPRQSVVEVKCSDTALY